MLERQSIQFETIALRANHFELSRKAQPRDTKMLGKIKVALSAAIVLATAFSASAATKHHRVSRAHAGLYDTVPSGGCSPVHAPLCSNICTGSGPCGPPDGW
jgi:hypothetical protein